MAIRPPEPESDYDSPVEPARARRGLGLIFISVLVIALTGLAYLHPSFGAPPKAVLPAAPSTYRLAAVDFVSPTAGWFAATFDSGGFAIMHTADAGRSWARQLAGPTNQRPIYLRFFDANHGLFALMGAQPLMYLTDNGGLTWSERPAFAAAYVLSMSFVDPEHGWLLVRSGTRTVVSGELFRTLDGGAAWTNLGSPVAGADQAYRVQFTDREIGWLDSVSARPYAYKTVDGGVTWRQVPLPAPHGGWPSTGQFFVAAQATQEIGVISTVATFAPASGRSGIGGSVVAYPPLTVRTFDGGVPVYYSYATFVDAIPNSDVVTADYKVWTSSSVQVQAPTQVQLGSLDGGSTWSEISPPGAPGAIGYFDAANWWWIGSGAWSTSSDGGSTWTPLRGLGVVQPLAGSLQVLDATHAWFGAMAGSRAVLETTGDGGVHWQMVILPVVEPS